MAVAVVVFQLFIIKENHSCLAKEEWGMTKEEWGMTKEEWDMTKEEWDMTKE